jgi:hypothetical protein
MASFGEGLGGAIGGALASSDLSNASMTLRGRTDDVMSQTQPYQEFGSSFLNPAESSLVGSSSNGTVGQNRLLGNGNDVQSYGDFMKDYKTSDAAKYTMGQATNAIDNSSFAAGKGLSGANLRSINQTTQDISSTYANKAYDEYLSGNNQQFGQLQSVLGNLFQGIGVGQTATGQNVSAVSSENSAQASIAGAQAKADAATGSGIGSMFSGLAGLAAK